MLSLTLIVFVVLGCLTALCSGLGNVTIDYDTGDSISNLLPIFEPLQIWDATEFIPEKDDINPYNISGPVPVTTTYFAPSRHPPGAWVILLFNGEQTVALDRNCPLSDGKRFCHMGQFYFVRRVGPVQFYDGRRSVRCIPI